MTDIAKLLADALTPEPPTLTLSWEPGKVDIDATVYAPVTFEHTLDVQLTPSFARGYLEQAGRFTVDGEEVTFEEFATLLDRIEAGTAPAPQPPTCKLSDAIDFIATELSKGPVTLRINDANWLVTRADMLTGR